MDYVIKENITKNRYELTIKFAKDVRSLNSDNTYNYDKFKSFVISPYKESSEIHIDSAAWFEFYDIINPTDINVFFSPEDKIDYSLIDSSHHGLVVHFDDNRTLRVIMIPQSTNESNNEIGHNTANIRIELEETENNEVITTVINTTAILYPRIERVGIEQLDSTKEDPILPSGSNRNNYDFNTGLSTIRNLINSNIDYKHDMGAIYVNTMTSADDEDRVPIYISKLKAYNIDPTDANISSYLMNDNINTSIPIDYSASMEYTQETIKIFNNNISAAQGYSATISGWDIAQFLCYSGDLDCYKNNLSYILSASAVNV